MKKVTIAIIAVAFSLQCSLTRGAVFSSTATLNQSFSTFISYTSRFTDPARPFSNFDSSNFTRLSSGVNSASVMVDTDLDMGFVSGMQFKPFTVPTSTNTHNMTIQRVVVDVPGNFPIPPVTHVETTQYSDKISITQVAPATPTLASSTTGAITPLNFQALFHMFNDLVFALPSIIVEGMYEATGPSGTRSFPFAVEFQPTSGPTLVQRTGIRGGQNFSNGFEFLIGRGFAVNYRPVNPVIFDEQVDELHFRASFSTSDISVQLLQGAPIPEPGAIGLAAGTAMALAGAARRRRSL
jgi:hypothetical protein